MPRPLGGWGMLGSERSVLSIGAAKDRQDEKLPLSDHGSEKKTVPRLSLSLSLSLSLLLYL